MGAKDDGEGWRGVDQAGGHQGGAEGDLGLNMKTPAQSSSGARRLARGLVLHAAPSSRH
jgi:hypothetical protein